VVQAGPFQEGLFNLGWRIPTIYHKDIPAVDVMSMILGYGDSSRLTKALRLERPLVNSIGAGSYTPKDEGLLTISGGFNTAQWKDILDQLGLELLEFLVHGPTPEEVERTKFQLECDELYSMETVDGLSNKIGTFQTLFGDPNYFTNVYLDRIRRLTARDITVAARKYITAKGLNLTVLTPDRDLELTKVAQEWATDFEVALQLFAKAPMPAEGKSSGKSNGPNKSKKQIPTGDFELRSMGPHKNTVVRQVGETSVLSFRAAFHGAQRLETAQNSGLHELLSSCWTSGTKNSSENDIASRSEKMAAGLRAFSGRNTMGLSLDCLAPTADQAFELFLEVLTEPTFPETIFEREKQIHLEHLRSRADNPAQVAMQKFNSLMFKGHVYEMDASGSKESVESLRSSLALESYKRTVGLDNLSLSIVGRFEQEQLDQWLTKIQAKLGKNKSLFSEMKWARPQKPIRHFEHTKKEQSHIIMGFPGLTIHDPRRYVLQVIQSVLAGQGGRLFLSLRDKASLAYSLSPMKMEGVDAGFFGTYIGCSPEKGKKALEMMREELKKLSEERISAAELERSQRFIIGRHDIDLQRNSSIATTCLFDHMFGLGFDHLNSVADKIRAVTADQVRDLSQELFSGPEIISVAGSIQPWD
ncbi:MAG: insulinase family protein, partial [Bdellovibrionales bacterium]|nr:insulinase family protein [Bdellovibrionales bacterium]